MKEKHDSDLVFQHNLSTAGSAGVADFFGKLISDQMKTGNFQSAVYSMNKIMVERKIKWIYKNYNPLIALFELLSLADYVDLTIGDEEALPASIANHFSNKGKDISAGGIRTHKCNEYEDKREMVIKELIEDLKNAAERQWNIKF